MEIIYSLMGILPSEPNALGHGFSRAISPLFVMGLLG
jgi:hypothetical protein